MLRLRQLHLYFGVIFAPALIFFAVTGCWQLFDLHLRSKHGGYSAPLAVAELSAIHKNSHLIGTKARTFTPFRWFAAAAAAGLVFSTVLGIIMALRFTKKKSIVLLLLAVGVLAPSAFIWIYK